MVGQNQKKDTTEYDLDQLVQSSFNYGDEQLLEQIRKAEEMIGDDQIPPEPEDGFEQLLAKMAERGITAYSESDVDMESRRSVAKAELEKTRKIRGLHTIIRVAIAAAIIGSVFTITSVTAGAKKSYEFEARNQGDEKNRVVINNEENNENIGSLEEAYEAIHNEIGIRVLRMRTRPKIMEYLNTTIINNKATISFKIEDHILILVEQIKTTEHSLNISAERESEMRVYNDWLQREIVIKKAVTDDGEVEFSAMIMEANACYFLSGVASESIFIDIVQNLDYVE